MIKKHVFRLSSFGSLYHEGEYLGSTPMFIQYKSPAGATRRIAKSDARVVETDDPAGVLLRYAAAWQSYDETVRVLEDDLANAKDRRQDAAEETLR